MNAGDLTTLDHVKQWIGLTGIAIASISNANPAVVTLQTAPQTPLLNQMQYEIQGVEGMALVPNALYTITVTSPTTFSIPVNTSADTSYTGGGVVGVDDVLVSNLITRVSTYIQMWLQRTIASATYNEIRDGQGSYTMMMKNYPITAVHSVTIDGIAISPRPPLGAGSSIVYTFNGVPAGWVASDVMVMMSGTPFRKDYQNIVINYDAGFLKVEAQNVPSSGPFNLSTQTTWSAGDRGVTYAATGVALKKVTTAPFTGQYQENNGFYTFAVGDAGAAVNISYAYVPMDIEQACIDTIGDLFRYRDRIGEASQAIAQLGTTAFINIQIPVRARDMLQQYKKVAPVM
jgi:hypothetical protein